LLAKLEHLQFSPLNTDRPTQLAGTHTNTDPPSRILLHFGTSAPLVILANAGIHLAGRPQGEMDACFHKGMTDKNLKKVFSLQKRPDRYNQGVFKLSER
jgi:hypothetical protein